MANVVHSTLTGTDLHEPKGIAAASSGELYFADGAGSGAWAAPDAVVFMEKHIAGLTYSNAADATNDITVTAGSARDSTNTEDMVLAASITKRLDAAWAVGDNQGGIDAGSAANTSYHIWLIKRVDTGVVDVLFSTSASSPTMPTNYTKKRRIGSFVRTGGANRTMSVIETAGGAIEVLHPLSVSSFTAPATTGANQTLSNIPTGIIFDAYFSLSSDTTTATLASPVKIAAWSPSQTGVTLSDAGTTNLWSGVANDNTGDFMNATEGTGILKIRTNTSAQVVVASLNMGIRNVSATTYGWQDYRRS